MCDPARADGIDAFAQGRSVFAKHHRAKAIPRSADAGSCGAGAGRHPAGARKFLAAADRRFARAIHGRIAAWHGAACSSRFPATVKRGGACAITVCKPVMAPHLPNLVRWAMVLMRLQRAPCCDRPVPGRRERGEVRGATLPRICDPWPLPQPSQHL